MRERHSTYQKEHIENVPSSPVSPSENPLCEAVSVHERILDQFPFDRTQGGEPARVGRAERTHERHEQRRGVERGGAGCTARRRAARGSRSS